MDNAPGYSPIERDKMKLVFFPPNVTSWKQPMDMGIIHALKKRYKYLYLQDVLNNASLPPSDMKTLHDAGLKPRRGAAGVKYGNPAHLLDAAEYIKAAWTSITEETIKNCFKKADINITFEDSVVTEFENGL